MEAGDALRSWSDDPSRFRKIMVTMDFCFFFFVELISVELSDASDERSQCSRLVLSQFLEYPQFWWSCRQWF
jgi:hypothetical protein